MDYHPPLTASDSESVVTCNECKQEVAEIKARIPANANTGRHGERIDIGTVLPCGHSRGWTRKRLLS